MISFLLLKRRSKPGYRYRYIYIYIYIDPDQKERRIEEKDILTHRYSGIGSVVVHGIQKPDSNQGGRYPIR